MPRSVTRPVGVRPEPLDVPGGELAALVSEPAPGTGQRRSVVLVPGFTGSKEDFLDLLALLSAAGHLALAYDQRGQYESTGPDDPAAYTTRALAADLRAVLDLVARRSGGPVHLLGHSYGGLVARRAVLDSAEALASLTLLGSGPGAIPGDRAAALQFIRPLIEAGGVQALWDASEQMRLADPRRPPVPDEVTAFLRERALASSPVGLITMAETLGSEPDLVDELAGVPLPMLVAHGAGDDGWPPELQWEMARRLGARYAVIEGALHSPAAEAPEATAEVLLNFWRSVDVD